MYPVLAEKLASAAQIWHHFFKMQDSCIHPHASVRTAAIPASSMSRGVAVCGAGATSGVHAIKSCRFVNDVLHIRESE